MHCKRRQKEKDLDQRILKWKFIKENILDEHVKTDNLWKERKSEVKMKIDFQLAEEMCSDGKLTAKANANINWKDLPGNAFGINDKFMEISFAFFTQSTH